MVSTLDVKVTLKMDDLTEREKKILHTLNASTIGNLTSRVINNSFPMNFLEKGEYDITHYELVFPEPISEEDSNLVQERVERGVTGTHKMSGIDIENLSVTFQEDGFKNR